ncbi:response regulator transcription factor [Marinomonas mediterranea]|jgi:Response regulators consisting of a CheY-like receiver domain and a winged-helix DNA-binding domain|uniref:Two component transcriptional regulator, winged helix family n=1 Tax=Marinomonas mediterranea (strain ATCC 700492 / JCM 21426 / NBRC 103028 / MMB-1) TaxID=717774 RepID=F2K2M6_MARM1|nr:response regulator transcription factor [Marinomonas mediterranea]ADZ90071.1 two component transcriptional regulator, winged helix family [Marinomonas mediterranea MMB-1]WCN08135.1 response regulator [Marinomonas mediterranea]WCN12204.1 response regulator [Marinomonas mediterranea]WCN16276.1 response regulator [Marinomonas mediterranea MMB-1]
MSLVYIIEDEIKIAEILSDYLIKYGYDVQLFHSGENAVTEIVKGNPDLVILDVMLPAVGGFEICHQLRAMDNEVPIIMLTARVDESDRLEGLNIGADDYVCKPFLPNEVVARVNAILRRIKKSQASASNEPTTLISYRNITIDIEKYLCFVSGVEIELTSVELKLLHTMMTRPKRIFSREVLMDMCYDDDRVVNDRTIDSHMRNLRKKLGGSDSVIQTVYGVGYKCE